MPAPVAAEHQVDGTVLAPRLQRQLANVTEMVDAGVGEEDR